MLQTSVYLYALTESCCQVSLKLLIKKSFFDSLDYLESSIHITLTVYCIFSLCDWSHYKTLIVIHFFFFFQTEAVKCLKCSLVNCIK